LRIYRLETVFLIQLDSPLEFVTQSPFLLLLLLLKMVQILLRIQ
jgi:hypothetical protein